MKSKQQVLIISIMLVMFCLLLLITFGDNGFIELYQLKSKRDRIIESNEKIELENRALIRRGDRLKYDRKYIENVARQELGLIGKDEIIFKETKKK